MTPVFIKAKDVQRDDLICWRDMTFVVWDTLIVGERTIFFWETSHLRKMVIRHNDTVELLARRIGERNEVVKV